MIKTYFKIAIIIILVISTIIVISYLNHISIQKREDKWLKPIGEMVTLGGNKMSVHVEGEGTNTLVFMSGGGTSSPILDFKALYSNLSDNYKIVVIEKFGYGFSDVINEPRNIEKIISEYRNALEQVGIKGPYILCPHSMSGIESLYWTQKYPDEVKAIVGLDMAVPESYSNYPINKALLKVISIAAKIGITRFFTNIDENPAIQSKYLDQKDKDIFKAIYYRKTLTNTMLNEIDEIKNSAKKVSKNGFIDVPILIFSSNGNGTGFTKEKWNKIHLNYINNCEKGNLIYLNCDHYIHNYEYIKISNEIEEFINNIEI